MFFQSVQTVFVVLKRFFFLNFHPISLIPHNMVTRITEYVANVWWNKWPL